MKKTILATLLALSSLPAFAITECQSTVANIFNGTISGVGDTMLVYTVAGTIFTVGPTDPNRKSIEANVRMAYMMGKAFKVRYTANGVNCSDNSGARTDAEGTWLLQ